MTPSLQFQNFIFKNWPLERCNYKMLKRSLLTTGCTKLCTLSVNLIVIICSALSIGSFSDSRAIVSWLRQFFLWFESFQSIWAAKFWARARIRSKFWSPSTRTWTPSREIPNSRLRKRSAGIRTWARRWRCDGRTSSNRGNLRVDFCSHVGNDFYSNKSSGK